MRLLAERCQLLYVVAVEGTDDGHHVVAVGQAFAQHLQVVAVLVVPLQFQVDAECILQLGIVQVFQHPVGSALQTDLHDGVVQRRHHGYRLLHPSARILIDNGIVLGLTASEQRTLNNEECCAQPHQPSAISHLTSSIIPLTSHIAPPPF